MDVYFVDIGVFITLNNGEKIFAPLQFHYEGDAMSADFAKLVNRDGIEYRRIYKIEHRGKVYNNIGNHPATEFMGIKFPENSIYKVYSFDSENLDIYYTNSMGEKDNANIGYGHLLDEKKKEVIDKFFKDLGIKQ